ncbi:helix-turn-helix transcriptional regulator [Sphaerisporangium sp. NPDC088356]|uniref:helix-turn-helix domain-containing protein n=1 Tax=Sphaerisporangium sp. NPDC088356 TaxID=3154871 RepID=UPI00341A3BF7
MTTFHEWDAVKREIFDDEDIAAIDEGTAEMVAAIRLSQVRRQLGLRQADVAERMHVRQERVSAIERGDPASTTLSTLISYVQALGGRLDVVATVDGTHYKIA